MLAAPRWKRLKTRDDVEEEVVSKIQAAMAVGGYIFGVDHSVPNDVPLENFRFAIELVKRYGRYG